ncbi:transposase [Streptomyces sp. NPDC001820]|uniref:IS110 family transposase n=1 Tax=Streptomyces sp. NPDC001820 TaxID=3364613 RepID=UPI003685B712
MTHTLSTPRARRHPPLAGEVVLGVDTHRDAHVAAAVSPLGAVIGTETFPATAAGYRQLLEWASRLGTVCRAGVEGTGSYGAALSRYLLAQHVEVFEVNRPDRTVRRRRGKSDMADAQAAAQAVLSGRAQARGGRRRIARLMRAAGLEGRYRRRRHLTTIPDPRAATRPDLILRQFGPDPAGVDTRWCGDITYVPTEEGWLYLATVIDIASRRVIGWATADHLQTDLVADALRRPANSVVPPGW